MKAVVWAIVGVVSIIILLLIGIVAGRVGGIAIRREGAEADPLSLTLSEPVVRGVPVSVHWEINEEGRVAMPIVFFWRDSKTEYQLGEGFLSETETRLTFPCDVPEATGTLVVRAAGTNQVFGSRVVELGAAGPECI